MRGRRVLLEQTVIGEPGEGAARTSRSSHSEAASRDWTTGWGEPPGSSCVLPVPLRVKLVVDLDGAVRCLGGDKAVEIEGGGGAFLI
jgi:hypothetical protein